MSKDKKKENKENEQLSKSMQKRIDRQNQNKKEKRNSIVLRTIGIVILLFIAAGIIHLITHVGINAYYHVSASNDYSSYLTENGYIDGVKASDYVTLCDYKNVTVSSDAITYSDEDVEADIEEELNNSEELSTETTALIEDGDKINLDYVGSIDGVEFEGGNSNGQGSDLTIGSGTFIDDFEQQLIGYGVGDNVTVEVTFPEDYNTEELAGKDAVFECTINGIYEAPELTDDFVKEHHADDLDDLTVKGYKAYLKETKSEEKYKEWAKNYLLDNSTMTTYPKNYFNKMKQVHKYTELETFNYMSQMYQSMYGMDNVDFYKDYMNMSEGEYDKSLNETCKDTVKENLIYQAIMEQEGIVLTVDDYKAKLVEDEGSDESFDNEKDTYGANYLVQTLYKDKVFDLMKESLVVTDK